jgi:ribosomal protein S18 acetylase RimI-like enzyme
MDSVGIISVEIAPTSEHIVGFHHVLDSVAREQRYLAFLEAPPIDSLRAFVLENSKKQGLQFVALAAGEVVGWCDVTPKELATYAHGGVLGMGLLPRFRGQGIGTALLRSTLDAARSKGLHRVELTVRESNVVAIGLYKKIGFETEGLQRDAVQVDGVYENVLCMAVLLLPLKLPKAACRSPPPARSG